MTRKTAKSNRWQRTIRKELHTQWRKSERSGDIKELCEITGKSYPTVYRALRYGYVNDTEFAEKISNFFIERNNKELETANQLQSLTK